MAGLARASLVAWPAMDNPEGRFCWDRLARRLAEPNPFFETWNLLPALRALDPKGTVGLLRIDCRDELIGLIPIQHQSHYFSRPIPHLAAWLHPNCFLGTPLVAAGHEESFWQAVLDWADAEDGNPLFLHLSSLALEGPVNAALRAALARQGRKYGVVQREERAMLASRISAADYFEESLSAKRRKELRRQFTRLSELGSLRFERIDDGEGLCRWIDDFLALEHSGWKGLAGSALLSNQATARLFREGLHGAARQGKLERLSLILDDEPIAMLVNFLTPPGSFSYKTAFDERFSRFSPGVLLQRENLALLDNPAIDWCDSCATADHPMIDHVWRERRSVGRVSIAIGGRLRRAVFAGMLRLELTRSPV